MAHGIIRFTAYPTTVRSRKKMPEYGLCPAMAVLHPAGQQIKTALAWQQYGHLLKNTYLRPALMQEKTIHTA